MSLLSGMPSIAGGCPSNEAEVLNRLVLTDTGRRKYVQRTVGPDTIRTPRRWDGKWRVVVFDIPNRLKPAREAMGETLRRMGFVQLQESVDPPRPLRASH